MGIYVVDGQDTSTANTTILSVSQPASALKRIKIGYVQAGSDVSADSAYEAVLQRGTADGTFTAVTARKRDPADGAASAVCGEAHSGEPSFTADEIMLQIMAHQRATYQWYAAPGREIIIPVTNDAVIAFRIITAATPFNMGVVMEFEE